MFVLPLARFNGAVKKNKVPPPPAEKKKEGPGVFWGPLEAFLRGQPP